MRISKNLIVYWFLICQILVGFFVWNDFIILLNWHIYITYISLLLVLVMFYNFYNKIIILAFIIFFFLFWFSVDSLFVDAFQFINTRIFCAKINYLVEGYVKSIRSFTLYFITIFK